MDLSALLAREGIEAGDLDTLVQWARQRAASLVARIEPGSHLAESLGVVLEHARDAHGVPLAATASGSVSRPTARAVSRPHLGAAVAAALSGKQEDLDLAFETAELAVVEREPELIAVAPAAEPAPVAEPESEPDDNDPSIGGFSRFAFHFRRLAAEKLAAEKLAAETLAAAGERRVDGLPEPPSFQAKIQVRRHPDADPNDGEASGLLVLGIPDEETIDIPVSRSRSAGLQASDAPASHEPSRPHEPSQPRAFATSRPDFEAHPMRPLLDDEDSFDLGLDNLEADPVVASDSRVALEHDDPYAHPTSGPHRLDSGPRASGPPPPPPPNSSPSPAAETTQTLRRLPPPPPRDGKARGRGRPPPLPAAAPVLAVAADAPARATPVKVTKRKKVVDLSSPVTRSSSAPFAAASPSERSGHRPIPADDEVLASPRRAAALEMPDYLRDDDE